jgi:hypothetical protein
MDEMAQMYVDAREATTTVNSALASGMRNAQKPDSIAKMRAAAAALLALADAADAR